MANERMSNRMFKDFPGNKITWRNMQGTNDLGNSGNRYFAMMIDDELAEELESEGWPVIWRNVAPEGEEENMKAYFKVFIKYGTRFPVNIYLVAPNRQSKVLLDEVDLDNLNIDNKEIESIDLIVRPYHWTYFDRHGVKAQVKDMNIRLMPDGFDDGLEIVYKND